MRKAGAVCVERGGGERDEEVLSKIVHLVGLRGMGIEG